MLTHSNKKNEARLRKLSELYRDQMITDKVYDIVDTALRLEMKWITIDDIWDTFVKED
jgi:hypothetical protein